MANCEKLRSKLASLQNQLKTVTIGKTSAIPKSKIMKDIEKASADLQLCLSKKPIEGKKKKSDKKIPKDAPASYKSGGRLHQYD